VRVATSDADPFRVLATCGVFEPGFRGGGMVRAVARTVDTASERIDLAFVTMDRDLGSTDVYPGSGRWNPRGRSRVFYLDTRSPRQWLRLWRALRSARFDLLHVNSVWSPAFTVVPVIAARLGLIRADRVLVSPHGEFSAGALSVKAAKKRLFLWWWSRFLRGLDVTWHAVTEMEADEIRAACPWAVIVVNHYQLALPAEPAAPVPRDGPARLVFLGRIAPKKNLHRVLEALGRVSAPVELDIYGPVEDRAYWARCRSLIAHVPARSRVTYRGEVEPDDAGRTFAGYDAFVFPTLGENFGYVIAESLSAACPVICSDQTPWSRVLREGGGVVLTDPGPASLAGVIERLAGMTADGRMRARRAAAAAYRSWRAGVEDANLLDRVRLGQQGADRRRKASTT
jgi:glycosyltransferase involved in cell wall biosynthesis